MRLVAGFLIVLGLITIAVALMGIRQADSAVHAARLAAQTTAHSTQTTVADAEARMDKLKQGEESLDRVAAQMNKNRTVFLGGIACVAAGIAVLLFPSMLRMVQSTTMTGKEREGKR